MSHYGLLGRHRLLLRARGRNSIRSQRQRRRRSRAEHRSSTSAEDRRRSLQARHGATHLRPSRGGIRSDPGGSLRPMRIVVLGLSITSSWGNGHATTYRALVRELATAGHDVLFLERDQPWYAENRDLPRPPYGETQLYRSLTQLKN